MVSVDAIRRNGTRGSMFLAGFTAGVALVQPDVPAIAVDVKTQAESRNVVFGGLNRLLNFVAYFIGGVMAPARYAAR